MSRGPRVVVRLVSLFVRLEEPCAFVLVAHVQDVAGETRRPEVACWEAIFIVLQIRVWNKGHGSLGGDAFAC